MISFENALLNKMLRKKVNLQCLVEHSKRQIICSLILEKWHSHFTIFKAISSDYTSQREPKIINKIIGNMIFIHYYK